jgi:hypothetical protein
MRRMQSRGSLVKERAGARSRARWLALAVPVVVLCSVWHARREAAPEALAATAVIASVMSSQPPPSPMRAARAAGATPSQETIRGVVLTVAGAVIEGARVCAASPSTAREPSCSVSDMAGRFTLRASFVEHDSRVVTATLFVSRAGYLPLSRPLVWPLGDAPLALTLRAGGVRVSGSVLDALGGPIAGALLSATNAREEIVALSTSDADGSFQLDVTPGITRLDARAEGYSHQSRQIRAPHDGVRLVLAAASEIAGRVLNEDTLEPVAGVSVTAVAENGLFSPPRISSSGEDGSFRFQDLPSGRYSLSARSERWRSDEYSIALGVAEVSAEVELLVDAGTLLHGTVLAAGAPCRQGSLALLGPGEQHVELDQAGEATFPGLQPGRYRVAVACQGAVTLEESLDLTLEPMTRVWDLQTGARVVGVALSAAGNLLPGAHIDVYPVGEGSARTNVYCLTDEHGEFDCAGLSTGDYDCTIGEGAPARSEAVRVSLEAGATARIELRQRPEAAIRARIEGAERYELSSLTLIATSSEGPHLGELDGDALVFAPLSLGTYELTVEGAAPGSGQRVELTTEGELRDVQLTLPAPHTLAGRVVDDDGQGVPDAWVRASSSTEHAHLRPVTPVLTNAEGAFALPGLVPGLYRLSVDGREGQARLDDVPSDRRNVELRLHGYGSLAGSFSDPGGAPIPSFVVAYSRSDDGSGSEVAGSQGAWSLSQLLPGTYELTASSPRGSATTSVELAPGGSATIALLLEPAPASTVIPAPDPGVAGVGPQ